jgi:hypothetical protein
MPSILDGKGKGHLAEVNAAQELVTRAITEEEIEHVSATKGVAFSWDSTELDIDAGDTMLFVKNTSDGTLVLDRLTVNGSNVLCTWDIGIGAATTTPSGTTVNAVNLNEEFSTKLASATALSDETAVADATVVDRVKTGIGETLQHNMHGIILGKNHYIQINQETESTSGSVVLFGHFNGTN